MNDLRLGILLWNQATEWPAYEDGARRVEELGYDHLWAWDHLHPIFGDPDQPIFEGWMSLAGWAKVTTRIRLGLLVGAIPFRNPGLVAKMATTLDHISGGRAILGLGGAWFEYEHMPTGLASARASANALIGSTRPARRSGRSSTVGGTPRRRAATMRSRICAKSRGRSSRTCRS